MSAGVGAGLGGCGGRGGVRQLSRTAGVEEGFGSPRARSLLEGGGGCGRSQRLPLSRNSGADCRAVLLRDFGSRAGFSRCWEHLRPLYPRAAPRCPLGTNFAFYAFSIASPCGSAGNRAKLNLWLYLPCLRSVFRSSV